MPTCGSLSPVAAAVVEDEICKLVPPPAEGFDSLDHDLGAGEDEISSEADDFETPIIPSGSPVTAGGTTIASGLTGNVLGEERQEGVHFGNVGRTSTVPPIGSNDEIRMIQTSDLESGHLVTGTGYHFGVVRADITPTNDSFRMSMANSELQAVDSSEDNSPLVRPLGEHSNFFVVLLVTSEILGMIFEVIYQESQIGAYFITWTGCCMISMFAARLLARIEGGMASREQFAIYLRCFSFLLLNCSNIGESIRETM